MSPNPPLLDHPIYDELLALIHQHRFITSHQLTRFTRGRYKSERSATRQTLRHVKLLAEHGLIDSLERRIGGWQGGSTTTIWTLTTRGQERLTGSFRRRRARPLSTQFLEHHLVVTEVHLISVETARATPGLSVSTVEFEPACWRPYLDRHGTTKTLKPDMFLQVASQEYLDSYYIEVDQATENPKRIIRKSMTYQAWQHTGRDQERLGVFPKVVWVTPSEHRADQLIRHLAADEHLRQDLFQVLTLAGLPKLILDGPAP